jgi:hypothetical protein
MVGTFADVVISDAIVKGVPGFELRTAKDALIKDVRYGLMAIPHRPAILFVHNIFMS